MTYKMNPEVAKILSPIKLLFENGESQVFENGEQLVKAVFDKHYNILSYEVKEQYLEIRIYEFYEVNKTE